MSAPNETELDLAWGAEAIATELKVTPRRAFALLADGEIPAKKVGGRWVADRAQLRDFFRQGAPA